MFTHIVFFKLKNDDIESIMKAREILLGMKGMIPEIKEMEVGVDVLHSDRSYDIALITRFDSIKDMKKYENDPIHTQCVLKPLKPMLDESKTVDYES